MASTSQRQEVDALCIMFGDDYQEDLGGSGSCPLTLIPPLPDGSIPWYKRQKH